MFIIHKVKIKIKACSTFNHMDNYGKFIEKIIPSSLKSLIKPKNYAFFRLQTKWSCPYFMNPLGLFMNCPL